MTVQPDISASTHRDDPPRWLRKLDRSPSGLDIGGLPRFGWVFVFRNLGSFRRMFWLLTAASVIGTVLSFASVSIVSAIISRISELSIEDLVTTYLPLYVLTILLGEGLDFFQRRYGEALPTIFADYQRNRFLQSLLALDFSKSANVSRERLGALIERYIGGVEAFLGEWFWSISRKITESVIVFGILYYQSPALCGAASLYVTGFLTLAFFISTRFAPYARDFAAKGVREGAIRQSFILNLPVVRRFRAGAFIAQTMNTYVDEKWASLDRLRAFHAKRWFLQLNLFNVLFVGALFYGVYQVKLGLLPLGFLLLIKWGFERLWFIVIFFIEYIVVLVQQREDTRILTAEFRALEAPPGQGGPSVPPTWGELSLSQLTIAFPATSDRGKVSIEVPTFSLKRGRRVGIVGSSGVGKTTLLNVMMNLVRSEGAYRIDGIEVPAGELPPRFMTMISNADPLFKLSVRDNILMGRDVPPERITEVIRGVQAEDFFTHGGSIVGDPDFNLSAGQEQRIRLARGLLQESEVYLLDEPFNSIDGPNKTAITRFLDGYLRGRTVVLVTHNPAELEFVDEIYSFEGGVLVRGARPFVPSAPRIE